MTHGSDRSILAGVVSQSDPIVFTAATRYFEGLPLRRRFSEFEDLFIDAVEKNQEDTAGKYLSLLETAYTERTNIAHQKRVDRGEVQQYAGRDPQDEKRPWRRRMLRLYMQLPTHIQRRIESRSSCEDKVENVQVAPKVKERMLRSWSALWKPEMTEESLYTFWLLCALLDPLKEGTVFWRDTPQGIQETKERTRNRIVPKAEQDFIRTIMKQHINGYAWKPETLVPWLQMSRVPRDIRQYFLDAWRSKREQKGLDKDFEAHLLLAPFEIDTLSLEGRTFFESLHALVLATDAAWVDLKAAMKPGSTFGIGSEKIGESEFVRGNIEAVLKPGSVIALTVTFPDEDEEALCLDVFGRACRAITAWLPTHKGFTVHLTMSGGKDAVTKEKTFHPMK